MDVSIIEKEMVIPREAGDDETVVFITSPLNLDFESTMDKFVDVYEKSEESPMVIYKLKFSTLPRHNGRKLKISSPNFETLSYDLNLKAKIPLFLMIIDPNGTIGLTCFQEYRNKGNKLYLDGLYEDAKVEYQNALACDDGPEESDIAQKMEDVYNCTTSKRKADELFNDKSWIDAKHEYEKTLALNANDTHCQNRIDQCNEYVGETPRQIKGKIVDNEGNPLIGVKIEAEYLKVNKKGQIETDKNGSPKKGYKSVGTTNPDGTYAITVLNKSKFLKFSKGNVLSQEAYYYSGTTVEITNDAMDIALSGKVTIKGVSDGFVEVTKVISEGTSDIKKELK
ncbi:hypothetical protein AwDysgo_20140 [Bacteroidales bacterium]|nr:hypothetical protein AwDysgo_20140 [Bacteroidales bacterium]